MSVAQISPEARERIRREAQEIRDRVLRGEPKPKRAREPRKPYQAPTGKKRGENLKSRPPKYSREQIKTLYENGKTVKEICEITGAHRSTIAKALNDLGIDPKQRKGGPVRKDLCGAGLHDMEVHGKELPGGGRMCMECKRKRDREGARRRYHEKKK